MYEALGFIPSTAKRKSIQIIFLLCCLSRKMITQRNTLSPRLLPQLL
jgi:hypothetical protein